MNTVETNKELLFEIQCGHLENVRNLILNGADVNLGFPLSEASTLSNPDIAALLIENGADVQAQDNMALCIAAMGGNMEMAKLLLKNGADKNCECDMGTHNSRKATAAEYAHHFGYTDVEYFISSNLVSVGHLKYEKADAIYDEPILDD